MTPENAPDSSGPRILKHYLPLFEIEPGATLGEPVLIVQRNVVRIRLLAGHVLTESNLRQLAALDTDVLCLAVPDTRSEAQIAADQAQARARVAQIFAGADLSAPAIAALFARVAEFRSRST